MSSGGAPSSGWSFSVLPRSGFGASRSSAGGRVSTPVCFSSRARSSFPSRVGRTCSRLRSGSDLKLSLSHTWNLWRGVSAEKRKEVIRAARQQLPSGGRCFDVGEFRNWEQLEIKYRQLAEELGHAGKIPAPGEVEFLHRMVDLDDVRYPGGIGSRDYFFLTCLVSILAPRRVIEIGTLTGFSTAIIAAAIYHQHGQRDVVTVDTIDSHTQCNIDESRPIAFEIPDLIPDLVSTVRVHAGHESDLVREIASPCE